MAEHAGKSLVEMLWEQADAQYAKLKELHDETGGVTADGLLDFIWVEESNNHIKAVEYLQTQGKVQALCFAVGTILYPYDSPKERIEKVRPMLRERWDDNNPEEDDDE